MDLARMFEEATVTKVDTDFYGNLYPGNTVDRPHTVKMGDETRPDESGKTSSPSTSNVQLVYVRQGDKHNTMLMAGILLAVLLLWLQLVFGDN